MPWKPGRKGSRRPTYKAVTHKSYSPRPVGAYAPHAILQYNKGAKWAEERIKALEEKLKKQKEGKIDIKKFTKKNPGDFEF